MELRFDKLLFVGAVVFSVAFLGYKGFEARVRLEEKRAVYSAIDGCYAISVYESVNVKTGVTTKAPMRDMYLQCLKDKGIGI